MHTRNIELSDSYNDSRIVSITSHEEFYDYIQFACILTIKDEMALSELSKRMNFIYDQYSDHHPIKADHLHSLLFFFAVKTNKISNFITALTNIEESLLSENINLSLGQNTVLLSLDDTRIPAVEIFSTELKNYIEKIKLCMRQGEAIIQTGANNSIKLFRSDVNLPQELLNNYSGNAVAFNANLQTSMCLMHKNSRGNFVYLTKDDLIKLNKKIQANNTPKISRSVLWKQETEMATIKTPLLAKQDNDLDSDKDAKCKFCTIL